MRKSVFSAATLMGICLLMLAMAASAQSLSIKKVDGQYRIDASASAGNPHTLQASQNLGLWVDLHEGVEEEPYSMPFDETGVLLRYFRLTPAQEPAPPIRVMLIGDSMAADCCGWGPGLAGYFKPNVTYLNYAQPWTTTAVFLQSAEKDKMLLIKPDYVLIQLIYSDWGAPVQEYTNNIRTIVEMIRGFNGTPILITLQSPRFWDEHGNLIMQDPSHNGNLRKIAKEMNVTLLDLYPLTVKLLNELGQAGAEFMKWPPQPEDGFHVSALGAVYVSRLVAGALPDYFGPYLTRIFELPPKP
jgi:lysophospholipase L1-like esterase